MIELWFTEPLPCTLNGMQKWRSLKWKRKRGKKHIIYIVNSVENDSSSSLLRKRWNLPKPSSRKKRFQRRQLNRKEPIRDMTVVYKGDLEVFGNKNPRKFIGLTIWIIFLLRCIWQKWRNNTNSTNTYTCFFSILNKWVIFKYCRYVNKEKNFSIFPS